MFILNSLVFSINFCKFLLVIWINQIATDDLNLGKSDDLPKRCKSLICTHHLNYPYEGGDPSPPSSRLTLLRLISDHTLYCGRSPPYSGWLHVFEYLVLSPIDGRCVQGSGTYSPPYSWPAITRDSGFMQASCSLQSKLRSGLTDSLTLASLLPIVPTIVLRVSPRV